MENTANLPFTAIGPRIRKSPYFASTRKYGCKAYSVYNHMYMPLFYEDPLTEYWNLLENVCIWDVACERQVEISGPDALRFTQYLCTRDISRCKVGQCMYTPLLQADGGILNDPVLLRLEEDRFWLSLADSDILLWARGLAHAGSYNVKLSEPYVSPLAVQGPKADEVIAGLFGDWTRELKFFYCRETSVNGIALVLARSGWSKQGGFELYLQDSRRGNELWEIIMEAGKTHDICPGAPSTIERIETGLLSYGSDMDASNNPFEVELDKFVDLEQADDFIGKEALLRISREGIQQKMTGIAFQAAELSNNENRWPVYRDGEICGTVRSATRSPRLEKNIAFAMLIIDCIEPGTEVTVDAAGKRVEALVTELPFIG